MTESSFTGFVRAALCALSTEVPRLYGRMVAVLEGREVLLRVDGEALAVCFAASDGPVLDRPRSPAVELETSKRMILCLARGQADLLDAIMADDVRLRGAVADLLAFHDALLAYLHGAVRSPSSPARLARFQRFTDQHPAQDETI